MKHFPAFKEFVSLVLVILVFTVSIAVSFQGIVAKKRTSRPEAGEAKWLSQQIQVEYLRFLDALDRYALADPQADRDRLIHRFDILWSRLPPTLHGAIGDHFEVIDDDRHTTKRLEATLERVDGEVAALAPGDRAGHRAIRAALEPFDGELQNLVLETTFANDAEQARFASALRQDYLLLAGSLAGVFLSGTLLILILIRQVRRARAAEAESLDARQQAEQASRAKSDFLAHMSHELRTPLNAIIGFAEVSERELLGPIGNPKYREYARDIHISGLHLLNLINGLLDLSKIEAGKYELYEEQICLADVTACSLRLVEEQARTAGLEIKVELPHMTPEVYADKRAFIQILLNLLSNAIKFTPAGGKVVVSARPHSRGRYIVCVADTGIGMDQQELAIALTPFSRVGRSMTRNLDGTGLGLSLAKYLAELHGCDLEIESQVGFGTAVMLVITASRLRHAAIAAQ